MEAAGLGGFVIIAGLLTILLEHPDLPVMQSELGNHAVLRRIPLGIILGAYITIVVLLSGKKSGAHIDPAVTWTFFRLGKIDKRDAIWYTIAQFAGASAAALLLKFTMGKLFAHPLINFAITEPKPPHGTMSALIAEFIISFILMLTLLIAGSSKKIEKYVAIISGALIALYIIIEMPFSGMSLNPARSFAAALAGNKWEHLWVYFVAPPIAMLTAGKLYQQWKDKRIMKQTEDYKEIPKYPVEETE
ncbi:MAG: aquaporin [Chitinophagales bacterium]|nr:aquaporin [Chitinophagales bacterium]